LFGNVFPDLVYGFTKYFNQKIQPSRLILNEVELQFHLGLKTHFYDDKQFHANKKFEEFCRELVKTMLDKQLDRNILRLSFLAHLLVEMLLDRWLCRQSPDLPQQFYEMLSSVKIEMLRFYFSKHEVPEKFFAHAANKRALILKNHYHQPLKDDEQITNLVCSLYNFTTGRMITNCERFRIIESIKEFYARPHHWQALMIG
jgi:hypothetical protein